MKNHVLDIELKYFEQNRKEWFKHHAGKFALVVRRHLGYLEKATIFNFYDNFENALKAGYDHCGVAPFLIKEILLEDRIEFIF
jgi:hypothetical protein